MAQAGARRVIVLPFDASRLGPGDQWVGEGVAQSISLGLTQHPAFVQIERARLETALAAGLSNEELLSKAARDAHVDSVLYGRIDRQDSGIVLQPFLLHLGQLEARRISLSPITIGPGDFLPRAAMLPAAYARTLDIGLTADESVRIAKAAQPTGSLRAFELFARAQLIRYTEGANDRVIALLLQALQSDPNFVVAQYTLASVQLALGNRARAAELFWDSVKLDRRMPEPYKSLGDLFLRARRPLVDAAIEAYSKAIDLRPFYFDAHVGLGDAKLAQGSLEGAVAAYQRAVALDPFRAEPYLKLARLYAQSGRCVDAVNVFRQAVEVDPRLSAMTEEVCSPSTP